MDPRIKELSALLTGYSCALKPGEKVLIDYEGECSKPLVRQLIKDAYKLGARPYVNHRDSQVLREMLLGADEEQITYLNDYQLYQMKGMDAYIAVRGSDNTSELSDVPIETLNMYERVTAPTLDWRVNRTKWVVLRYPNPSMAQLASKSQEAFEDFFFNVCTLDYNKMSRAMDPLVDLMQRTDKVHLVGPDTDLTFSIKGIPAVKCDGRSQHSGRRGLHRSGQRIDERRDFLQYLRAKNRASPTKTSASRSRMAKSSRQPPTTPNASMRCWILMRARAISANLPSVSILMCCTR